MKLRARARDRSRERVASGRARGRLRERVASGAASESHLPPAPSVFARVRAHVRTYVRAHARPTYVRTYVRTYVFILPAPLAYARTCARTCVYATSPSPSPSRCVRAHARMRASCTCVCVRSEPGERERYGALSPCTYARTHGRTRTYVPRRPPPLGDFPHSLGKRKRAKAFSSFPFQTPAPCLADVPGCRRMNGKVVRSIFERAPMAVVGRNAARRPYQSAIRPQVRPESWREGEGCSSPMPSRARTRARARGRARGRAGCRWW